MEKEGALPLSPSPQLGWVMNGQCCLILLHPGASLFSVYSVYRSSKGRSFCIQNTFLRRQILRQSSYFLGFLSPKILAFVCLLMEEPIRPALDQRYDWWLCGKQGAVASKSAYSRVHSCDLSIPTPAHQTSVGMRSYLYVNAE